MSKRIIDGCEKLDRFMPKELNIWFHSRYFYPNICHLCNPKNNDNRNNIIRCTKCNMISYCGNLHQSQHATKHQDLCNEIQNLLKSSGCTNLFDFLRRMEDPDKRLKKKRSLIATVEKRLKRKLESYETQMFLHPRVCCVCLESDPASLFNCQSCAQVSFCKNHINAAEHKDSSCFYYEICLNLDWRFMFDRRLDIYAVINFSFFPSNPETFQLPENMDKFLEYVEATTPIMKILGDIFWRPVCSELYSNSLTLMHVLKNFELAEVQSELILNVIGIQNSKEKDFVDHETLLHFIPQLKNLKVVVVGKELEQNDKITTHKIGICEKCVMENKTLIVEMIKLPYASYVETKSFVTPHLIISYNFGESEMHLRAESLLKMVKIQAPFVMTTNTKLKAETEHKKMTELLGYLTSKSSFEKNPFASKRPYRDAWGEGLNFGNSYITVYILYEEGTNEQTKKETKRGRTEIELPDFVKKEEQELRPQKSLQKKRALQNELSEDSQNSVENIKQSPESNPDNKDGGEGKSKKKKKKKANQASNSARESSLFDKEENLKDTKEKVVPETLDSQINATEMSKELLNDHILDRPSQNQESDKKKEDDLVDEGKSGAEVSSSDKETEGTNEKSSTEEQRSNSENEKKESKPNSEGNPEKSENSSADNNSSLIDSRVNENSSSSEQNVSENKETLKDRPAETNNSKTQNSSEPAAGREEMSQENSVKKEKNEKHKADHKQGKSMEKMSNPSKQNETSEGKAKPKDESTGAQKSETTMPVADGNKKSENKIQEQKEESNKSRKKKNKSKNPESSIIQTQKSQNLQNVHSSKQNGASEDKQEPKDESTGAKKSETSMPVADKNKKSENKIQEQKEGSNKSKKKKNKSKNPEASSIQTQELQKLQNVHSSKQNGASEVEKNPKVEATNATKPQTSKTAVDETENSESKVQEQKEGSNKSRKKKNKKPKTEESSEYSIEKDELLEQEEEASNLQNVDSLSATKRKAEKLQQQNDDLQMKIEVLSAQFTSLKKNCESIALNLLKEISTFKNSLEGLEKKLTEAFKINDDVN